MIDSPRVCVHVQSVYVESQSSPDEISEENYSRFSVFRNNYNGPTLCSASAT